MNADTSLLARANRRRLAERLAELADLGQLMHEAGGLPSEPPPVPLHRMNREPASSEAGR